MEYGEYGDRQKEPFGTGSSGLWTVDSQENMRKYVNEAKAEKGFYRVFYF
jgi:hypothetical protein